MRYTKEALRLEKLDLRHIALGLALTLVGAALIVLTASEKEGLARRRARKSLLGGAALVAVGLAASILGRKRVQCVRCGSDWDAFEAYFPVDTERAVCRAVDTLNVPALSQLSPAPEDATHVHLSFDVCKGCRQTGALRLHRGQDARAYDVDGRFIEGDGLCALASLGELHEAYRERLDEAG